MTGMLPDPLFSRRLAARARSCCKTLTIPPSMFSFLAIGRVTGELRTSTGDAAVNKAKRRVTESDAKGNMDSDTQTKDTRILWPIIY